MIKVCVWHVALMMIVLTEFKSYIIIMWHVYILLLESE